MKYFRAFRFPDSRDTVMVKQGVHWRFLVLGPFGFLVSRHWTSFALTFLVSALLVRFADMVALPVLVVFNFVFAMFASEIMGWENRIKGASCAGLWLGFNRDEAMTRYADRIRAAS